MVVPLQRNESFQRSGLFQGNTVLDFLENETVSVRVLSVLKNNAVRIAVKGAVLYEKAPSGGIQEGAFLFMRAHIEHNSLFLIPDPVAAQTAHPHEDIFAQLNMPRSELAAELIAFFRQNEQPLQSRKLLKILASLHAFYPHQKEAAFAASLLYSHGVEPSPSLIEQCLAALCGLPAPQGNLRAGKEDEADLFRFLNHVKAGKNHWVVFPFEKKFETEILWKGSAAFLLDLQGMSCLECCLRIRNEDRQESWVFTLKNNECTFHYNCKGQTELSMRERERLIALLSGCFETAGVTSYTIRYSDVDERNRSLESIDISV